MRLTLMIASMLILSTNLMSAPKDWPKQIRFGVIPVEGGANVKERFKMLTDHLQQRLGVKVITQTASDYSGVITAMSHDNIEAAYFGPKSYVEAAKRADAEVVAMEISKAGKPGYYGIIISKKGSPYTSIKKSKGSSFAFTDPNSTSGYLVPNILFRRDMKVDPSSYFKNVKFSGTHGAAILAVKNGAVDVAATNDIDLDRAIEEGQVRKNDFNVLWRSELIPGAALAMRKELPKSLKDAFAKALVDFSSNKVGMEKLQNGGFRISDDKSYDVVRYLVQLKKTLK